MNSSTTNKMSKNFHNFSRHRHLCISFGIGVGIGIGIAKNLFFPAKSLFLSFKVLYEEKIHGEVRCLEQLFCRKPRKKRQKSRKKGPQYWIISFYSKDIPTFNELVIKNTLVKR